ncbi:MAG TPA: Crp/Fnr family transcriptional regulator [Rubrivivax sp.]|nr:Crp/Fnr family transcriptional regulator [Rubrivivax sp.]
MFQTPTFSSCKSTVSALRATPRAAEPTRVAAAFDESARSFSQKIAQTLKLVSDKVVLQRRVVHAGDRVFQAGEQFGNLFIVNSGFYKIVTLSPDGREQVVALKFRGDWLGMDGMAQGAYSSDAIAMDTGEVWAVRYDALLEASLSHPALLTALHQAMSRELARERDSLMSVCTLSGDARVADFLRSWADSLAKRNLRNDQITLRMTRAEIGNYLGLTLESVSRALSRLARAKLIVFAGKGRRDVCIPDVSALSAFVQATLGPAPVMLQ